MISKYFDRIFILQNNHLRIHNEGLNSLTDIKLTLDDPIGGEFTSLIYGNYLCCYKTLYKIENDRLVKVHTFNKRLTHVKTNNNFVVVCESTGELLVSEKTKCDFKLLLGHYMSINSLSVYNTGGKSFIVSSDEHKIRISDFSGRIENILFIKNEKIYFDKGVLCAVNENMVDIFNNLMGKEGSKCSFSFDENIKDILILESDLFYVIALEKNYFIKNFVKIVESALNFKDAFLEESSVYFYNEENKLEKMEVKDLC